MHEFAVFDHNRTSIGRWLGITSLLLTGAGSQLVTWLGALSGWEAFTKATFATGCIYYLLHLVINKFGWRVLPFNVPNLNGEWDVLGQTISEDGSVTHKWSGRLEISQTWEKIQIQLRTDKSVSSSYTASILKRRAPSGGWLLNYSYDNEPELEQSHELSVHKGFCEIRFDREANNGKGTYLNSNGRRTYGVFDLKRSVKK